MNFETISTDRLTLRKIDQEVYDYVFKHYNSEELKAFFGLPSDEALAEERLKYEQGLSMFNRTFLYFQLIDRSTKQIIGWCGYHTWYQRHERAEIGYGLFDESYKQKGIMTEAMTPILTFGFDAMHLNRIEAFVGPDNQASIKLLEKMNFSKEGHLKQHFKHNDKIEDSLAYALLKSELK